MNILNLVRDNIKNLKPYSSARNEYSGANAIFLDANENPFNYPLNRYPDPLQMELKEKISKLKNIPAENIFLGNGSDEAIDLLIRIFCEPSVDNIISIEPTYGMYKVCADINNVAFKKVLLDSNYQIQVDPILKEANKNSKLMFICSPNNPTSNSFKKEDIITAITNFKGIVVLDEAYIDFSGNPGFLSRLFEFPNLVILHTLSKAWGLAGIRLGMAFADEKIITMLNKVKYPYNINRLTQEKALEALSRATNCKTEWVNTILKERQYLIDELSSIKEVVNIYPSDANFLLVKIEKAKEVYEKLVAQRVIVRDRSQVALCNGCLRITVGLEEENKQLIEALKKSTYPS